MAWTIAALWTVVFVHCAVGVAAGEEAVVTARASGTFDVKLAPLPLETADGDSALGRMSADIIERPRADRPLVVVAWSNGSERRKHYAGTALFTDTGDLLACSQQTWIQIDAHAHVKGS